jgi:membrane-bound ClpP family serine protease
MTLRTEILTLFADPTNAYVVLLAGATLITTEFLRPGRVLPGVGGAVLFTLALHALLQWQWTTYGGALLVAGFLLGIINLARESQGSRFLCAASCGLGSGLLIRDPENVHPAAALAGGTLAFCCSWLLGLARRARLRKHTV